MDASYVNLLSVFQAVVEENGISNAQARLNKDASTISKSLTQLEARLGLKLCERGRQGFKLTAEGESVYRAALTLFSSFRFFEQTLGGLGGAGFGPFTVGIIDNIISDPACPLVPVLAAFVRDTIDFNMVVGAPGMLERGLRNNEIDAAIGIFDGKIDGLAYVPLYGETDGLYCAAGTGLAAGIRAGMGETQQRAALGGARFVSRKFLNNRDLAQVGPIGEVTYASNIEAVAFLILSGHYVGFLPEHYARRFVEDGTLCAVCPGSLGHASSIELVVRDHEIEQRPLLRDFCRVLRSFVK